MEKLNRYLRALLAIALCAGLLVPTNLTAWGPEGHIVIATIANARLTPAARAAVRQLLGRHSLASVANFADQIRPQRPETANWHFVDIPKDETNYDPGRDCQPSPKGDCVIAAIARAETALKDRSLPRKQRAEALKFLVHFVGDLHQPLHCSDNHDRGGNDVNVSFLGRPSNLHRVWDSGIIGEVNLPPADYAAQLDSWLDSQDTSALEKGTTVDWALQAHKLAKDDAYKIPDNHQLDVSYVDENDPIVDQQLAVAGLRLAKVLNDTFASTGGPGRHRAPH